MEVFGIGLTFLAGVLTYLAWHNGKWMKETLNKQNELLSKMSEMIHKQTEMLNKQTEILYKIDETLKVMERNAEERHREIIELIKQMK